MPSAKCKGEAMTARRLGMMACVFAVLLLGMALVTGRMAYSAGQARLAVAEAWVRPAIVPGRPAD